MRGAGINHAFLSLGQTIVLFILVILINFEFVLDSGITLILMYFYALYFQVVSYMYIRVVFILEK